MVIVNSSIEGLTQVLAGFLLFGSLAAAAGVGIYALFNYRQRHK